jgi:hypothetical protein
MDEQELLYRIFTRAFTNGWPYKVEILPALEKGLEFDAEIIARGIFMSEEFVRYFWKDSPHPEQHLLGMQLVENPLTYLKLYVD